MLKNISFVNIDLRITETPFLCLKSSSRLTLLYFWKLRQLDVRDNLLLILLISAKMKFGEEY